MFMHRLDIPGGRPTFKDLAIDAGVAVAVYFSVRVHLGVFFAGQNARCGIVRSKNVVKYTRYVHATMGPTAQIRL